MPAHCCAAHRASGPTGDRNHDSPNAADPHRGGGGRLTGFHRRELRDVTAVRLGINHEFDFMVGAAKSKSAILERLQPETSDACIYVGDTEFDMREAQKAGFLPIGLGGDYRPGASLLAAGAAAVVDDLSELIGLLGLDGHA